MGRGGGLGKAAQGDPGGATVPQILKEAKTVLLNITACPLDFQTFLRPCSSIVWCSGLPIISSFLVGPDPVEPNRTFSGFLDFLTTIRSCVRRFKASFR